ncbi:type 2 ribosome-inactivating protein [Cinnamomum micranthum f. kanehirae]|uniref:Ribosome-inactivating protein n=1 Tax=Cinnamomum micranthum f. kanehirae TaxID=337451 RepID=A0A443PL15_9MAGN|nr:type 2 ribosome-inactivating protein [Cinnamomum micranthum f. kanehirae]
MSEKGVVLMKGNMKAWVVVAIWVWWNAMVGPAWVGSLMVAERQTLNFETVAFTTGQGAATVNSYTLFIEALRTHLKSGKEAHGIPLTRERATVSDAERYVLVELSEQAGDSVSFAVDVTNASVVAYQGKSRSFFLQVDIPALFPNSGERIILPFDSSYTDLERVANVERGNIDLGMTPLANAIANLDYHDDQSKIALDLIVVNQMVLEAVRFRSIEYRVRRDIPNGGPWRADPAMISLENNWEALSSAIQKSTVGGVFSSEVVLHLIDNNPVYVGSVSHRAISGLALMLFVRKSSNSASSNRFIDHLLMTASPAVDVHVAAGANDDDTYPYPEPTVRISGRNGLCVAVSDGEYHNGSPIQLWPCNEQLVVTQLWTLRKDGTIQSNGKCLTSYDLSPGAYMMIYDCPTAVTPATFWQVRENGAISHRNSALVLSAESGDTNSTLSVETNIYASRQGWLAGNHTEPFVASIIGFQDLCMQANGDAMWMVECASGKANQKWALYPDGSIRPQQNQDHCLTSSDNNSQGSIIIISSCSPGSEGQRWVFKNDGTILNLKNGLVMDVKESDQNLHQIIIYPATGNPNQKWFLYF